MGRGGLRGGAAAWDGRGMAALARVTAVTVTYESAAAIGGFLAACPPGMGVVVVDNGSRDASASIAEAAAARVIRSPVNRGFGTGCNLGLDAVGTEFALLANPDVRLTADAVERLVAAADAFPEAALFGPGIVDAEGRRERSWNAGQFRRRVLSRKREGEAWPEGPACVEFLSGACLLVRMAAGLRFDEALFLFYDDDDFCETARARGHALVLVPAAVVAHAGGGSSAPSPRLARFKAWHMAHARLQFAAKHRGPALARREGAVRLLHHAGKLAGHVLSLQPGKAGQDAAALAGTLAWWLRRRG